MKILLKNGKPLFKDGKLLASSRGSGSATVTTKAGWFGTTVPNTGHVDKVYFNTNLGVEEVLNIITNIECHTIEVSSVGIYGLLYSFPISLIIYKYSDEDYTIQSAEYGVIWSSIAHPNDGRPHAGWYLENDELNINLDLNNVVGNEVIGTGYEALLGFPVGEQNDILSSLFSTEPFTYEEAETITLTGDYDGSPVTIELGSGTKPSTVPNTGYVENVYFNTSLSTEEVVEILNTLEDSIYWYDIGFENDLQYWFAATSNTGIILLKQKSTGNYQIGNPATREVYFNYGYTNVDFTGWNPQFKGSVSILGDAIGGNPSRGSKPGDENYRLTSLISSTPYSKPNYVNLKSFIEEKKLPLKINVKGPKVVKGGNASGTPIPSSGHIENIYVNVNSNPEELANKLDELLASVGIDPAEGFEFPLFFNEDETVYGGLFAGEGAYGLVVFANDTPTYAYVYTRDSAMADALKVEVGFIGWNPALTDGVIPVNTAIVDISILLEDYFSMWEMAVNEITPFISSTPFVSSGGGESIELVGEYDGSTVNVKNLNAQYKGTTVPYIEGTYVENLYFNTSLSVDEVRYIVKNANLPVSEEGGILYSALAGNIPSYGSITIIITMGLTGTDDIIIMDFNHSENIYFHSSSDQKNIENLGFGPGWNPNFSGVIEYNGNLYDHSDTNTGVYNNRITELFSITPFEKLTEANTIDIKNYISNNKIPLQFKLTEKTYNNSGYYKVKDTINITENNTYDIAKYAKAYVDVSTKINDYSVDYSQSVPSGGSSGGGYIYFNTSLNVNEMLNIFNTDVSWLNIGVTYCALYSKYNSDTIIITLSRPSDTRYIISVVINTHEDIIFDTEQGGWIKDTVNIHYKLEFGGTLYIQKGLYTNIGSRNSKLSKFMATSPMAFSNAYTLSGEYEPYELEIYKNGVTDLSKCIQTGRFPSIINTHVDKPYIRTRPQSVYTNGYIPAIYFNTTLSVEEVESMLKTLTYNYYNVISYLYVSKDDSSKRVEARKSEGYYAISANNDIIFSTFPDENGHVGWAPNFNGVVTVNDSGRDTYNNVSVGSQNSELLDLMTVSKTASYGNVILWGTYNGSSFTVSENGEINLYTYMTEYRHIPLIIDIDVPTPKGITYIHENGTHDVSQYAEAYVNVSTVNPSGTADITTTEPVNVYYQAYAQVKDDNLIPENIKKDISILGIVGNLDIDTEVKRAEAEFIQNKRQMINDSYINEYVYHIDRYALAGCYTITTINETNFPWCQSIDTGACFNCSKLSSVNLPKVTYIGDYAFSKCEELLTIDFPKVEYVYEGAFAESYFIKNINLPLATSIGNKAFYINTLMPSITLPSCTEIGEQAFYENARLADIYLGSSEMVTLTNANTFFRSTNLTQAPINIHVRSELLSAYQADTIWSEAVSLGYILLVGDYTD